MKATAEWFPAKERGLAGGIFNIGASVGSMLAPPLVAWAILTYNWRAAFVITGVHRARLGGAVAAVLPLARVAPALSAEERDYIVSGQEQHLRGDGRRPSIGRILQQRNFWGIAMPRFLADPTWGTLTFWLPLYLNTVRHFDLKQIALFAWLPFLAADLGCMFGGSISLWLQKYVGVSLINARRGAFTIGALLMTGVAFVGAVESPYAAIALLCLGGFAHQTLSVTVITMSSDLFKRNEVATVAGMAGTCGNAGVLMFSLLIGALVATDRLHAVLRLPGRARSARRAVLWTVVREPAIGPRWPSRLDERSDRCPHHPQSDPAAASIPIRRSCASATTTTSRPPPSSGSRACRSTTRAIWCTGGCSRGRSRAPASSTCSAIRIRAASGRRASPTPTACSSSSTPT